MKKCTGHKTYTRHGSIKVPRVFIALPKGSLCDSGRGNTLEFLLQRGIRIERYGNGSRYCLAGLPGFNIKAVVDRPQNMCQRLSRGEYDMAIMGLDTALEYALAGCRYDMVSRLGYGYSRLSAAAMPGFSLDEMLGSGRQVRVATEYPLIAREWVRRQPAYSLLYGRLEPIVQTKYCSLGTNPALIISDSDGATESSLFGFSDMIVETVGTGATLQQNGITELGTVLESQACLFTRRGYRDETGLIEALSINLIYKSEVNYNDVSKTQGN